jgi:hypothetical protein
VQHEVEENHFLSCFREALRPTLRYLFFARESIHLARQ